MTKDPRLPEVPYSYWQRAGYNFFQVMDHFVSRGVTRKLMGGLRYRNFLSIVKTMEKRGEGTIVPVEYRTDLSLEEFRNYYVKNHIPVVFKGAARNWGCVRQWSLSYFKNLHGEDEVPLLEENNPEKGLDYTTLGKLIDRIENGDNKAYFRFYNLLTRHPEHNADFDLSWLKQHSHKRKYFDSFQVFIGGAGSTTYVHNAHISNLFVQAHGVKEWFLYPNYHVPFIDPPSTLNGIYRDAMLRGKKAFNAFDPNYEEYPYYKFLDGYSVKLQPGDVLFNPPFMWHTVRNETDSIGVGYRWINAMNSFKAAPTYYLLDLMAYKPNYFKSLKMVRKNANQQFEHRLKMMQKRKRVYEAK
ncbi:hypothetical protein GC194_14380 [bacterium]|nr:hypothetical protein [bacterium]